jgi:hypothetical protein
MLVGIDERLRGEVATDDQHVVVRRCAEDQVADRSSAGDEDAAAGRVETLAVRIRLFRSARCRATHA